MNSSSYTDGFKRISNKNILICHFNEELTLLVVLHSVGFLLSLYLLYTFFISFCISRADPDIAENGVCTGV